MISVGCLIYKSPTYADAVYDSIMRHTPMLADGRAEFYFVANDPTQEMLAHLQHKGYKHYVQHNAYKTRDELFAEGIGKPEYINRVYKGWNRVIQEARGDLVVIVSSDNMFSPMWLENLTKPTTIHTVVASQLIEPGHPTCGIFPGAHKGAFGRCPQEFQEQEFLALCKAVSKPELRASGAYGPMAFMKRRAEQVGLYPEGNMCRESFDKVVRCGDAAFVAKMQAIGMIHITAMDSLVYHFKEGEMDERG